MKLSHSLQIFAQIFHADNLNLLKIKLVSPDFFSFEFKLHPIPDLKIHCSAQGKFGKKAIFRVQPRTFVKLIA